MASVTRINGLAVLQGFVYQTGAKAFRLQVYESDETTPVNLSAEDDAVDEACEHIIKELNPLMYSIDPGTSGIIHLIMDVNADAEDMALRVRNLGTAVGPNNVDVSGTKVGAIRNSALGGLSITPDTMLPA